MVVAILKSGDKGRARVEIVPLGTSAVAAARENATCESSKTPSSPLSYPFLWCDPSNR